MLKRGNRSGASGSLNASATASPELRRGKRPHIAKPLQVRFSYSTEGRREAMNDLFEKRVRAAAVAGWWVVLIAVGFLTLLWLVYLAVTSAHPAWLLSLWGPGVDWPFVQGVWFWAVAAFKFCVWLMILA